MSSLRVGMVGATGAVGKELVQLLFERDFPCKTLRLFASQRSAGKKMETPFGPVEVEEAREDNLKDMDLVFFSAGGSISKKLAPKAVQGGALVIDNSSAFRMDEEVPLVVPEVNAAAAERHQGIVANPNCTTIVVVVALKPLHDALGLKRVVVSTYQAASGVGGKGIDALTMESLAALEGRPLDPRVFPHVSAERHFPLAFNLVPHVDVFEEGGYTKEEWKMVHESRKILNLSELPLTVTNVRVPVFRCHAASVNVEVERQAGVKDLARVFREAPGVVFYDDPAKQLYPMPSMVSEKDEVYVGRCRRDFSTERAWNLWVVGDQIRKGAALNAIQIAEHLNERDKIAPTKR